MSHLVSTSMSIRRPRFSYGVRWLLFTTLLLAIGFAYIGHEVKGRIVLESDIGVVFRPAVAPVVEIGNDSDLNELQNQIVAELWRESEETGLVPVDVTINEVRLPDRRLMMYFYDAWVRQRLDPWRLKYEVDYNDPVAASRNGKVIETIERIARLSCTKNLPTNETEAAPGRYAAQGGGSQGGQTD